MKYNAQAMTLFKINGSNLQPISEVDFESYFDKEKKLQQFTENNLQQLFGLEFIATEFNIESFWLDTLAFDTSTNSFVIIEYKKVENFSLMDQGQTYLNLVLDNKADVLLEYVLKTKKELDKKQIDWSQTRVIFIGPKFNTYQRRALSYRLPFELWEVAIYENGTIEYDQITPIGSENKIERKSASVLSGPAAKEIKVYTEDDLVKPNWIDTKELLHEFQKGLMELDLDTRIKYTKHYVGYVSKHGRNYVDIVPQNQGIKVYFRFPHNFIKSPIVINDCSHVGHWANGISRAYLKEKDQIPEFLRLAKESFLYLHNDIYSKDK